MTKKPTHYGIVVIDVNNHSNTRKHTHYVRHTIEGTMKHYDGLVATLKRRVAQYYGKHLIVKVKNLTTNRVLKTEEIRAR